MNYAQYGAGLSVGDGWLNFDSSPTLRLQRIPLVGKWLARKTGIPELFPEETTYGDVVKGLPLKDGSLSGLYASHVLEHLALLDMRRALEESYRVLKPGGIFRLVVPDLKERARRYLESDEPDAAHTFMRITDLGHQSRANLLRAVFGSGMHLWMYDYSAMAMELEDAGFTDIRPASFGDAKDPMFARVEAPTEFVNKGISEVAIECRKPT